jgi:hypothetical protein
MANVRAVRWFALCAVLFVARFLYVAHGASDHPPLDQRACQLLPAQLVVARVATDPQRWQESAGQTDFGASYSQCSTGTFAVSGNLDDVVRLSVTRVGRSGFTSADRLLDEVVNWPSLLWLRQAERVAGLGDGAMLAENVGGGRRMVSLAARKGSYAIQILYESHCAESSCANDFIKDVAASVLEQL